MKIDKSDIILIIILIGMVICSVVIALLQYFRRYFSTKEQSNICRKAIKITYRKIGCFHMKNAKEYFKFPAKRDYKGPSYLDYGRVDDLIITDGEIKEAIKNKEIFLEPFSDDSLQPASYDMRLGDTAIISKTITIEELHEKVENKEIGEIDVKDKKTLIIPPGAFALLTTLEKIGLTRKYAGHIGMRSYFTRKGLILLSGIQIDPGFEGHLVLGACNLSPRSLEIRYGDPICTIELYRLNKDVLRVYSSEAMEQQKKGKIPMADKDYLRTIETMSVSDLTTALTTLSRNVDALRKNIWYLWIPLVLAIIISICTKFL